MATYTPTSKIIGTTGASGINGFTAIVAAANTAMATAVTAAQAVTGVAANSIVIGPAQLAVDTDTHILEVVQTITYTVVS